MFRETPIFYLISLSLYLNFFICFTRVRFEIGHFRFSIEFDENIDILIRLRLISSIVVVEK